MIAIGHCVLSLWSEIVQNSSAFAQQCTSFWQLCLHWSWHCQRRKFWNTCVWCNINLEYSKTCIHCFMSLRRRYLHKAGTLLFR